MKIVSPYKDYYDGALVNYSPEPLYVRTPKEEEFEKGWPFASFKLFFAAKATGLRIDNYTVGFCGKAYRLLHAIKLDRDWRVEASAYCYDMQALDDFIAGSFDKKLLAAYKKRPKTIRKDPWGWSFQRPDIEKFFEEGVRTRDKYAQRFVDNNSAQFVTHRLDNTLDAPCLTYRGGAPRKSPFIEWNARLRDYEFYRVFPPFQAFQELEMYWNNMAHPNKPIPHVPDQIMAEAKGFNKFSFRKDPKKS